MNEYEDSRIDELLTLSEELQSEVEKKNIQIEGLQKQLQTSVPSSIVSELKNKIEQQAEEIDGLNRTVTEQKEQIETKDGTILMTEKENDKLKEYSRELKSEVELAKRNAINNERSQRNQYNRIKNELDENVRAYKEIKSSFAATFFYGIIMTVFSVLMSDVFMVDIIGFGKSVWDYAKVSYYKIVEVSEWSGSFSNGITQPVLHTVIYVLLFIIPIVALIAILLFPVRHFIIVRFIKWYRKEVSDHISLWVVLTTLAISITLGRYIKAVIPINLILLNLAVHLLYCGIRAYMRARKRNRRK